jgi:hypothetical protein
MYGACVKLRSNVSAITVMATTIAGLVFMPSAATAAGIDAWAQDGAHATRDNYNAGEARLTATNAGKAKPRWRVPLNSAKCTSPSQPLVGANRLVTAAAYRINGYDATTGALKWRTPDLGKRHIALSAIVKTRVIAQYRDCRSGKSFLTALDTEVISATFG